MRLKTLVVLLSLTAEAVAVAGVSGRLVVTGHVPAPEPIGPGRDACCQEAAPVDQSVVVGQDGGLANVLVSVEPRRGEPEPPKGEAPVEPALLTNKGCAFAPRLLLARVGQPLVLENDDPTLHNVNIDFVRNRAVNVVVEPGGRRELTLERPERKPVGVRCNVHTFMSGWVAVRDDAFAAVSDPSGRFELPPLPEDAWRLRFWHEGRGLAGLRVGESETDARGEVVVRTPADGGPDLGTIRIAAESLR